MVLKIFKQLFEDMNAAIRTLGDQSIPCELENIHEYDSCYQILDPIKKVVIERQIIPLHQSFQRSCAKLLIPLRLQKIDGCLFNYLRNNYSQLKNSTQCRVVEGINTVDEKYTK